MFQRSVLSVQNFLTENYFRVFIHKTKLCFHSSISFIEDDKFNWDMKKKKNHELEIKDVV